MTKMEEWQVHYEAWRRSGLTQTKYCAENDLSLHKFKYWRKKCQNTELNGCRAVKVVEIKAPLGFDMSTVKISCGKWDVHLPAGMGQDGLGHLLMMIDRLS